MIHEHPLLDNLNPQQRAAATHIDGPILVFAGAGSGKTRVLTHRIAYLVQCGVDAQNILAITFTNKAAGEMKERVKHLLGQAYEPWVSTFHAFCARVLRMDGHKIGVARSFIIYDSHDQTTAVKMVLSDMGLDDKRCQPALVLSTISKAKSELISPEAYAKKAHGFYEERLAEIYRRYQRQLATSDALDFDDLLMKTVELLERSPETLRYYQDRFLHILVDEYQDTNHAQYVLVNLLAKRHRNVFVVGDDDQNIYSFRGASSRNILEFERDYPEARVIRLEQNYRSTQNILDVAYSVIKNNRHRAQKRLWTENGTGRRTVQRRLSDEYDEARFVADEIMRLSSELRLGYSAFGVLYRTHAQSRVFEEVLMHRQIPYVIVGGIRFYERKEIKDVLSYLRLISGARDPISARRIINVPKRGIGESTLLRLEQYAYSKRISLVEAIYQLDQVPDLTAQARLRLEKFADMINDIAEATAGKKVYETIETVLSQTGYFSHLVEDGSVDALTRAENIRELMSVALEFDRLGSGGLDEFLEGVALLSDIDNVDDKKEAVVLMTLHSAKGLEFPVVFLVGLEEGVFPHMRSMSEPMELEEERRLCYVGMTRARRQLYLTHTYSRTLWGRTEGAIPSRFLSEVPAALLDVWQPDQQAVPVPRENRWQRASASPVVAVESDEWSNVTDFRPGDRVVHPRLGPGVVVSQKGSGPDAEIGVAFPDKGVKILLARYANLKKE